MNAEQAIEAPRFQTRHLVSSFDNHAMNPGDLLLDERIPQPVMEDLAKRGHKIETRSRWNSGAAPVLIKRDAGGRVRSGRGPVGLPVHAGLVSWIRSSTLTGERACELSIVAGCSETAALRSLAAARHLHRRQFVEI